MRTNGKIRKWYVSEYPDDELGKQIKPNLTFNDCYEALDRHEDFYAVIGVGDSLIRERIFSKLASVMIVDYGYIYNLWLNRAN